VRDASQPQSNSVEGALQQKRWRCLRAPGDWDNLLAIAVSAAGSIGPFTVTVSPIHSPALLETALDLLVSHKN
jgi:hypothetical protein